MTRLPLAALTADEDYARGGFLTGTAMPDENAYLVLGHLDIAAANQKLAEFFQDDFTLTVEVTHRWVVADTHTKDCEDDAADRVETDALGEVCDCLTSTTDDVYLYALHPATSNSPDAFAITEADTVPAPDPH